MGETRSLDSMLDSFRYENRVELHAHTNFCMNSVISPRSLVQFLYKNGYDGVAVTDTMSLQSFTDLEEWRRKSCMLPGNFKLIYGMEAFWADEENLHPEEASAITVLIQNEIGRVTLNWLLSEALLNKQEGCPILARQLLLENREGLLIGSGYQGDVYHAIQRGEDSTALHMAGRYDYLEIFPGEDSEESREINRKIVEIGGKLGKPVIAAAAPHYLEKRDEIAYRILQEEIDEQGQPREDTENVVEDTVPRHFFSTEEMLEKFAYLGEYKSREVVIFNTHLVANQINQIQPLKRKAGVPTIPGAAEIIENTCMERLQDIYGTDIPEAVWERYETEYNIIIRNDYTFYYVLAMWLVKKSKALGYPVGTRGMAGASYVSYLMGITELNPLPKELGGMNFYYETFLGLNGDRTPDFDFNFAEEVRSRILEYLRDLFGKDHVLQCNSLVMLNTNIVYKAIENYGRKREVRLGKIHYATLLESVRRCTACHPGGVFIIPKEDDVYEYTAIQKVTSYYGEDDLTAHFNTYGLDECLPKIDLLVHPMVTKIKLLHEETGVNPETISIRDEKVMELFRAATNSNSDADNEKSGNENGLIPNTKGLPEFETEFMLMLMRIAKPDCYEDLVNLVALSHGTDAWNANAEVLLKTEQASIGEIPGSRDRIMAFLLEKGLEREDAYQIMEYVRKGKADDGRFEKWADYRKLMLDHWVPHWYIWYCENVRYLFPESHAAEYTWRNWQLAYYKVYYPEAFEKINNRQK